MTRRLVSAVFALGVLLAIVVGVPALLVLAVGNPWPGRDAIDLGDSEAIFVGALAAVGWVVWARLVAALLVELVEQVRQIREYRFYQQFNDEPEPFEAAPPASRGVAGQFAHRLIIALLILVPIVRTAPVQASTPDLPTRDSVVQTFDGGPVTVEHIGIDTRAHEIAPTTPTVVTAPGDSLMSLAERHLGDTSRWREIFELNRDMAQPGGERLTTPSALRTGWTLELPGDAVNFADSAETITAEAEARESVGAGEILHTAGVGQPSVDPANRDQPADKAAEEVQTYVVQPGDGPWDVADALLGDGMRYQEVLDANVGHEVAPGHTWTADQRVIHPGWVFSWGPDTEPKALQEAEQREAAEVRDVPVTVESGDTLWGILEEHSGRDVSWGEVERTAARNDGTATPDGAFAFDATNPDLIHPGQEFVVEQSVWTPPADRPHESKPVPEPSGPTRGNSGDEERTTPERPRQERPDSDDVGGGDTQVQQPAREPTAEPADDSRDVPESAPTTAPAAPVGTGSSGGGLGLPGPVTLGLGAAALSAGLLTLLEVSRRRRLRTAEIRHRLRTPPAGLVETERRLRQLGDGDRLVRIDVALRTAVEPLLAAGRRVAAASIARNGCVLLHADGPITAGLPAPWESVQGSQQAWRMPGIIELDDLAGRSLVDAPCPGLMPIGTSPTHGEVYVDVECAETLWLDVTDVEAERMLRGVCAGLASSVFAERASLIGVGIDAAWLLGHPNGYIARSVTEAMEMAARHVEPITPGTSTFELRARNAGGEQWQPAIVVVAAKHAAEMGTWRSIPGVAAVVAADPAEVDVSGSDTRWVLRPQLDVDTADASWRLDPLEITMTPVGLGADEFAAIDELLRWERSPALPPPPPGQQPVAGSIEPQRLGEPPPPAPEPERAADEPTVESAASGSGDLDIAAPTDDPSPVEQPDVQPEPVPPSPQQDETAADWPAPVVAEPDHADVTSVPLTSSADPLIGSAADANDLLDDTGIDPDSLSGSTAEIDAFPPLVDDGSTSPADLADGTPVVDDVASEMGDGAPIDVDHGDEDPSGIDRSRDPDVTTATSFDQDGIAAEDVGEAHALDDTVDEIADFVPEPPWSLMVRVFGLVDVVDRDGTPAEFRKAKTLELLAWLTLHRDRGTRAGARSALWEVDVTDATFSNVVSEARRGMNQLATAPEGSEWLGRTLSSGLPLHDEVISDVDLVELRVERARHQLPEQGIATLEAAVELIRGLPFAETGYLWPDAEGITSRLVVLATSTTTQLADLMLRTGDVDGVFRATGVGLRVLPGHEDLIGLRMRAHAARGDRAGIRQEWETYERVLAADTWSDGEPSPTLVELRQHLLNAIAQRSADTR